MSHIANFEQLGYTSDHVRRDISVTVKGKVWKGFTWNLQEHCYSKNNSPWGHANNPLNCTETKEQYEFRKIRQINEIVDLCKRKELDFGCLQEVDFCFPELYNNETEKVRDWLVLSLSVIKDYFIKSLSSINFEFVTFEDKEIVIIYSINTLIFKNIGFYLPFKTKWDEKNHLALATFEDSNGNSIMIGSMHGNYNDDYSTSVLDLLNSFRSNGQCVIIGGDMNHPPKYKMSDLLVLDDNDITNFMTNYGSIDSHYTKVELLDSRCGLPKAYDGFLVSIGKIEHSTGSSCDALGLIEISGDYAWGKQSTPTGEEFPVLLNTKLTRKIIL